MKLSIVLVAISILSAALGAQARDGSLIIEEFSIKKSDAERKGITNRVLIHTSDGYNWLSKSLQIDLVPQGDRLVARMQQGQPLILLTRHINEMSMSLFINAPTRNPMEMSSLGERPLESCRVPQGDKAESESCFFLGYAAYDGPPFVIKIKRLVIKE